MTSTYLHGLDDEDIPQKFHDELDRAAWLEWRPDIAALLNALLLAGWVAPSRATATVQDETLSRAAKVLSDAWTDNWPQESGAWRTLAQALAAHGLLREQS